MKAAGWCCYFLESAFLSAYKEQLTVKSASAVSYEAVTT